MNVIKSLLNSRKVQLALIAIVAFIIIKIFKIGEEQAGMIADKVVELVMVLIGAIAAEDIAAKLKLGVSNPESVLEALKTAGKKGK